jgi:hypothetical protein
MVAVATPVREDAPPRVRHDRPDALRSGRADQPPIDLPLLRTKEQSQPTASKGTRMRLVIDKQPEGTRSPNLADAVVMAYADGLYDSMEWV